MAERDVVPASSDRESVEVDIVLNDMLIFLHP